MRERERNITQHNTKRDNVVDKTFAHLLLNTLKNNNKLHMAIIIEWKENDEEQKKNW